MSGLQETVSHKLMFVNIEVPTPLILATVFLYTDHLKLHLLLLPHHMTEVTLLQMDLGDLTRQHAPLMEFHPLLGSQCVLIIAHHHLGHAHPDQATRFLPISKYPDFLCQDNPDLLCNTVRCQASHPDLLQCIRVGLPHKKGNLAHNSHQTQVSTSCQ